jgi:hypothetical protein
MIAVRHRAGVFSTIVAVTAAFVAAAGPAAAVVPGFDVRITELPDAFAAGAGPDTVTAVASTVAGRRCQKVRWSMVMRVEGVRLDQVKVDRVEETGSFALRVQADGDTARLTDAQLDPGTLCPGRTVTARYRVAFDDAAAQGRVTFQAEAYDTDERLLQLASATTQVVGDDDADETAPPETEPTPSPTPSESDEGDDADADESEVDETVTPEPSDGVEEAAGDEAEPTSPGADSIAAVPTSAGGSRGLLGAGLIIGAVLIFLGVGLLLRLRMRGRRQDQAVTTRFHPAR